MSKMPVEPAALMQGLVELAGLMAPVEPKFRNAFLDELEEMIMAAEALRRADEPGSILRARAIAMIVASAITKTASELRDVGLQRLAESVKEDALRQATAAALGDKS